MTQGKDNSKKEEQITSEFVEDVKYRYDPTPQDVVSERDALEFCLDNNDLELLYDNTDCIVDLRVGEKPNHADVDRRHTVEINRSGDFVWIRSHNEADEVNEIVEYDRDYLVPDVAYYSESHVEFYINKHDTDIDEVVEIVADYDDIASDAVDMIKSE